jgi:ABC-type nitrate/sulfonate/bicarbonate transport system substrate-binding protein
MTAATVIGAVALLTFRLPAHIILPALSTNHASSASLRLDGPLGPEFAGEIVARQNGLFAAEGISVDLQPGGAVADPLILVANGTNTFGIAAADRFLIARADGAPIVAFAAAFLISRVAFYTLASSHIQTPADFVGKRIGYRAGQDTTIIYQAMMSRMLVPRSDVHEVQVTSGVASLINGQVDVLPGHVGEEAWALEQKGTHYETITPNSFGVDVVGTVYFTTEKTIRDEPMLVTRFLRGVIAGWKAVYQNEDLSVQRIAKLDPRWGAMQIRFDLDSQRELLRPYGTRIGEFSESQWQSLEDILVQQRLLRQPLELPLAVSYDFLRDAYNSPDLGR